MKTNNQESERIAKLWRVGRLLIGKTQNQLAKELHISQSNISKFESMALEPSASDWYNFCQFVGIDAHKTLSLGYIDGKKKFKHRLFGETLLKLPIKYRQDFLLKIRELIPFRECIIGELGIEAWESFLTKTKISDELFYVYDYQVSMNLLNDLIKWSEERNFLVLDMVKRYIGNINCHGVLNETYARKKKPQELLKTILEDQAYYHQIFKTEIAASEDKIEVVPHFTADAINFFEVETLNIFLKHKINSYKELLDKNSSGPFKFKVHELNQELSFSVSA